MAKTYLYRHYDKHNNLLYVGISVNALRRLKQHKKKRWYSQIAKVTLETYPTRNKALQAEEKAIKSEKPYWNVIHNKGNKTLQQKQTLSIIDILVLLLTVVLFIYLIY
jgi:predicted GIY-YIG superfamily endonuclease